MITVLQQKKKAPFESKYNFKSDVCADDLHQTLENPPI